MTISTRPAGASRRISGPTELIQAIPYLLGFHPADSLVLVGLAAGHLVVTARLDLADAQLPGMVADTVAALCDGGSEQLIGAVYDAPGADRDGMPIADSAATHACLVDTLSAATDACGAAMLDVLLVDARRWRSLCCSVKGCCPAHGVPLPDAPSAFAAAATYDGMVALADRDELALLLAPLPDAVRDRLRPGIEGAAHDALAAKAVGRPGRADRAAKRAVFAAARAADAGWVDGPPDDAAVARFVVALTCIPVRDAVWMAIDDGRLDGRELWRELARRVPSPYDAAPLFLHGWASWRSGDGALANIAASRAVDSDPCYSAADLLLAALSRGLDPRRFPKLRLGRTA